MKAANRIGEKHGKLTVLSRAHKGPRSFWICMCECGASVTVSNSNLVTGNTKSCGCNFEISIKGEMIGSKFGSLTVLDKVGSIQYGSGTFARYFCRCDCGGESIALGMSLRNGDTTSCGCAHKNAQVARRKPETHHRAVAAACCQRRRAARMRAFLPFDVELFELVELEAYRLARTRTAATGVSHEVDHRVPLQGKTVSGLHNEFNLGVIPRLENCLKSNRYWPDMPTKE